MWNNNFFGGKNRFTAGLEAAGGAITDLASNARQQQQSEAKDADESSGKGEDNSTTMGSSSAAGSAQTEGSTDPNARSDAAEEGARPQNNISNFFKNNGGKWRNVLEQTRTVVQTSTQNLLAGAPRSRTGIKLRDASMPLDTDALRDSEVVYITDRIVTMGHPALQSSVDGNLTAARKLAAVGHLMHKRHVGKYMVWNLSEVEYDYSVLSDQVLAYNFPGSPSPPLGLLLKLIFSMESWLKADSKNVAVLHCLTGKGRTSTVLACFLCWTGEAGFHDPMKALEYIALCKRCPVEQLTIPSQRRYVTYFSNMLDGVRPNHPPLILKRVILSEAAKYERDPNAIRKAKSVESEDDGPNEGAPAPSESNVPVELGCSPYLQIFKAGQLILTTAPASKQHDDDLPFCLASDGSITFSVEAMIQGDILLRCRHLSQRGQRVSMFRAAFHTGYTPPKVMRLSKAQLDGACTDRRFTDDFFVDLVFEACDASMASKHLLKSTTASAGTMDDDRREQVAAEAAQNSLNEASARRAMGAVNISEAANSEAGLSSTTYDTMLHRDARFWDAITDRRKANMARNEEGPVRHGPTIGRRRNSLNMKKNVKADESSQADDDAVASAAESSNQAERPTDAFTIGGMDFDFGQSNEAAAPVAAAATPTPTIAAVPKKPKVPKKDDLMDALMALDSDEEEEEEDITFSPAEEAQNEGAKEEKKEEAPKEGENVAAKGEETAAVTETPKESPKEEAKEESEQKEVPVKPEMVPGPAVEKEDSSNDGTAAPLKGTEPATDDDFDAEIDQLMDAGKTENDGEDFNFDDDDEDLDDLEAFLTS